MTRHTAAMNACTLLATAATAALIACERGSDVLTISGSAVGAEAELLETQVARYMELNPGVTVKVQITPDAADQRHQLYVQWLNAGSTAPDVLQLDVIWTPQFAAAGWIQSLDRYAPPADSFFASTVTANTWRGELFALPWFVDVGMLYWRTDLMDAPPSTFSELANRADAARRAADLSYGFVWQGARYEGLITVFLEFLGAHGGAILDDAGNVTVADEAGVRALAAMFDAVHGAGISPEAVLGWQEEQVRFAFQNGNATFMRNWPYAYPLMQDSSQSRVAGRFAVAPMPAAAGGEPTAALGGAQLAINANSRQPDRAYDLIAFLLAPEQIMERARVAGQYPPRPDLYDRPELAEALAIPPAEARRIIEASTPRPVTPVYAQLSEILQIHIHRALTRQVAPEEALRLAAAEMEQLLARSAPPENGLAPSPR